MILPEQSAFSQMIEPPLGHRSPKPRQTGLTMVIDKGLGWFQLKDLLETGGSYVDIVKFGFGTATLYPRNVLKQKLSLARLYGVECCTGGTLAEIALAANKLEGLVDEAEKLGFTAMEISDGTIVLDAKTRSDAIRTVAARDLTVVSEVGKKLDEFPSVAEIVDQVDADLQAGARFVILEGRESGEDVGIYGAGGAIDERLLDKLIQKLPSSAPIKIVWEAPKKAQQVALIRRLGQSVNLGNVDVHDVLAVESLRLGLRSDTFVWSLGTQGS